MIIEEEWNFYHLGRKYDSRMGINICWKYLLYKTQRPNGSYIVHPVPGLPLLLNFPELLEAEQLYRKTTTWEEAGKWEAHSPRP